MPRRGHVPDPMQRRQVEALAGYGVPETDIARMIGIDAKTLRKHYRDELDLGHVKANAKVAENLFRKATGEGREAVTAAIFWLKARARWKETVVNEHAGDPNNPLELVHRVERVLVAAPAQAAIDPVTSTGPTIDLTAEAEIIGNEQAAPPRSGNVVRLPASRRGRP